MHTYMSKTKIGNPIYTEAQGNVLVSIERNIAWLNYISFKCRSVSLSSVSLFQWLRNLYIEILPLSWFQSFFFDAFEISWNLLYIIVTKCFTSLFNFIHLNCQNMAKKWRFRCLMRERESFGPRLTTHLWINISAMFFKSYRTEVQPQSFYPVPTSMLDSI